MDKKEYLQHVISLWNDLSVAKLSMQNAEEMAEIWHAQDEYIRVVYKDFFGPVTSSLFHSAYIRIMSAFDIDSHSVSIYYLKNMINEKKEVAIYDYFEKVRLIFNRKVKAALKDNEETIKNMRKLRNKFWAHKDINYSTGTTIFDEFPVDKISLNTLLDEIIESLTILVLFEKYNETVIKHKTQLESSEEYKKGYNKAVIEKTKAKISKLDDICFVKSELAQKEESALTAKEFFQSFYYKQ